MRDLRRVLCAVFVFSVGCATIPPEIVTSGETLQSYSKELGAAQAKIIDFYHGKIAEISTAMTDSAVVYVNEYESDVRTLLGRIDALTATYDELAKDMARVLEEDGTTTRATLLTEARTDKLRELMANEEEARGADTLQAIRGSLDATDDSSDSYAEARKILNDSAKGIKTENTRVQGALKARAKSEYGALNAGFNDLIAYLRSLLRVETERKRVLGRAEKIANDLAQKVESSDSLTKIAAIFGGFDKVLSDKETGKE